MIGDGKKFAVEPHGQRADEREQGLGLGLIRLRTIFDRLDHEADGILRVLNRPLGVVDRQHLKKFLVRHDNTHELWGLFFG